MKSLNKSILIVSPYDPMDRIRAADEYIVGRLKLLGDLGYETDLLCVTGPSKKTGQSSGQIFGTKFTVSRKMVALQYIVRSFLYRQSVFLQTAEPLLKVFKSIQKHYEHIFIDHSFLSSLIVDNFPDIRNKIIVCHHNIESAYYRAMRKTLSIEKPLYYYAWLEERFCRDMEKSIYSSPSLRHVFFSAGEMAQIQGFYENIHRRAFLIPSHNAFYSQGDFDDSKPVDQPCEIAYFGNLGNERNLDAIKMIATDILPRCNPKGLTLSLYGRDAGRGVEQLRNKYGSLAVKGPIDLRNIPKFKTLFVMPSTDTAGVQTKIIDAICAGALVLTSKAAVDSLPQLKEVVLTAETAQEFAYIIDKFHASPDFFLSLQSRIPELLSHIYSAHLKAMETLLSNHN